MAISVIIPCYNEESRLGPTLREIEMYCKKWDGQVEEVIIIDDGSKDRTVERAMYFVKRMPLKIVRHQENKGKWAAIRTGMVEAKKGNCVLLVDADGSASIWELEKCSVPVRGRAVYGSRFMRGSVVEGKSFLRTLVSQGYRMYVLVLYWAGTGRTDVDDMQCPWKLFYVEDVQGWFKTDRFAGDIEMTGWLDADVSNHPVHFIHKRGSKVPLSSIFTMAWETLKISARQRFARRGLSEWRTVKAKVKA